MKFNVIQTQQFALASGLTHKFRVWKFSLQMLIFYGYMGLGVAMLNK